MPVIMCTVLTACLCFTAGGIPNLMPSMVISKFGRYEFMSANRVCTPLATIIQSCGFAILVLGKSLGGGNNWVCRLRRVRGTLPHRCLCDLPDRRQEGV